MGTTIQELVFMCCLSYPKADVIDELIELSDSRSSKNLIQSIFNYENKGRNCLCAAFEAMILYDQHNQDNTDAIALMPLTPIYHDIESLILHLLQLAEMEKVNMDSILNSADESGQSIFHRATDYSFNITKELLRRNVKVNRIDFSFCTPYFRVSQT